MARVCLVIPAKNEAASLPGLLDSVRRQTRQPDEVVVVDAGSSDATPAILDEARKSLPHLSVVRVSRAYPGTARNIGVENTRSQVIAFTDAGIRLKPDWLEQLLAPMEEDPGVQVVYGSFEPCREGFLQECAALVYVPPVERLLEGAGRHHFVASMVLTRDAFERTGGFPDYRAAEDRIFMERLDDLGLTTRFAPRASLCWEIPATMRETVRRFRTLSRHDLIAGRGRDWHARVFLYWAVGLVLLPLFPLGYLYRVIKNMRARRLAGVSSMWAPRRVLGCVALTLATDCGLFLGAGDYWRLDRKGHSPA